MSSTQSASGLTNESSPRTDGAYGAIKAPRGYIPVIDGLRAVSISFVLLGHFGLGHIVPGGFGVTVFFLISGFLITRLLLNEIASTGSLKLTEFYARRFARLAPALVVFILLTISARELISERVPMVEVAASALYMMNYYRIYFDAYLAHSGQSGISTLGILWSLAVEEHFYILFPIFLAWLIRRRMAMSAMLLAVVVALAWRVVLRGVIHVGDEYTYMATDTRFDSILYGSILALLFQNIYPESAIQKWVCSRFVVSAALAVILLTFVIRTPFLRETLRYSVQGLALMPIVAALTYRPEQKGLSFIHHLLISKPLIFIGKLSYSLYLWHYSGIAMAAYLLPRASSIHRLPLSVSIAIVLSLASYFCVERSFISLRRRLGSGVR